MVITGLTRNQLTGNRPWVRIPPAPPSFIGMWLSLVEHYVRDVGAAGSNPVIPTTGCSAGGSALDWGSRCRRFKSCHSDHFLKPHKHYGIQCLCGFSLFFNFAEIRFFQLNYVKNCSQTVVKKRKRLICPQFAVCACL